MIIHITQPDGTRIMGLTEAGQVIRGGMNSHGLGSVSNHLQSIYDAWAAVSYTHLGHPDRGPFRDHRCVLELRGTGRFRAYAGVGQHLSLIHI